MHVAPHAVLCSTQLAFRKGDELIDDPCSAGTRTMPAVAVRPAVAVCPAVAVLDSGEPELAAQ